MLENHRHKFDILSRDNISDPISEEVPLLQEDRLARINREQAIIDQRNLELKTSHEQELAAKKAQQEAEAVAKINVYHTILGLQSEPDGPAQIEQYRRQLKQQVEALAAKGASQELQLLKQQQATFNAIAPPETFERNPLEDKQWRQHLAKVEVEAITNQLADTWLWELGKKQRLTERLKQATAAYNKLGAEIQASEQEIAARTAAIKKTQAPTTFSKQWYTASNMIEKIPDANVDYNWHPSPETRGTHAKEVHTSESRLHSPERTRVLDAQARIASQEADIASRAKAEVLQNLLATGISKNEYRTKLDQDIASFEAESSEFEDESPEMVNLKKLKAQRAALNEIVHEEETAAPKTKRETMPTVAEKRQTALREQTRETQERKEAINKIISANEREIALIAKERDTLKWWNWLQRGDRNAEIAKLENQNTELRGKLQLPFLKSTKSRLRPEYNAPKVEVSSLPEISAADLEPLTDESFAA